MPDKSNLPPVTKVAGEWIICIFKKNGCQLLFQNLLGFLRENFMSEIVKEDKMRGIFICYKASFSLLLFTAKKLNCNLSLASNSMEFKCKKREQKMTVERNFSV